MARRSLRPQLNQIRTWVRQGRTDAWIAHQLEASVRDITNFKREHGLEAEDVGDAETDLFGPRVDEDEVDLRAEDEARVAAALEEEARKAEAEDEGEDDDGEDGGDDRDGGEREDRGDRKDRDKDDGDGEGRKRRRRGRRGGRGRKKGARKPLEGTFDHGEDGYGLWLDPAIQDDRTYAEHWAGHRAVKITIEPDKIVIERSGSDDS